jgi:hypothetical protein
MNRKLTGACLAAALGVALSASAQQPPQPQPSQPTPPAQAATVSLDRESKLSGCLKSGTENGTFELATSKKAKGTHGDAASNPSTTSQAPTQDAMAAAGASKNVKLVPATGVDLAAHLNHQVEVAGSWSASAGASAEPSSAGASASVKAGRSFSVTSVKMISANCSTGTE